MHFPCFSSQTLVLPLTPRSMAWFFLFRVWSTRRPASAPFTGLPSPPSTPHPPASFLPPTPHHHQPIPDNHPHYEHHCRAACLIKCPVELAPGIAPHHSLLLLWLCLLFREATAAWTVRSEEREEKGGRGERKGVERQEVCHGMYSKGRK